MVRYQACRLRNLLKEVSKEKSFLTNHAQKIFNKAWQASEDCYISGLQGNIGTVFTESAGTAGTEYVVNTSNRTCQCMLWRRTQIPCKHACRIFRAKHRKEGKLEGMRYAHPTWRTKEVEQCLIRGIGDSSIPDWCILHDLIDHEGKLSDAGLIHIWGQVQEKERVREKYADFNSFQKWWRTEEGKDKYVLQPQHDYPRCLCSFCDNKIKTRKKRGAPQKPGRRESVMDLINKR